jgi:hypothetical protein
MSVADTKAVEVRCARLNAYIAVAGSSRRP